jgi:hypothetical protein
VRNRPARFIIFPTPPLFDFSPFAFANIYLVYGQVAANSPHC